MGADGWPCPHCGSGNVDRGFTGLDECRDCGGLSRAGRPLRVENGRPFYENVVVLTGGDVPSDDRLRDFLNDIAANFANPAVIYIPDGLSIETLDEAEMARADWYREAAVRDAYEAGAASAGWMTEPGESADEVIARLTMRGTDGISTEGEADGAAADQPG